MKSFPVKMEIYDAVLEAVATITCFDEGGAEIKIAAMINPHNWPEISAEIAKCLVMMFPDESK